MRSTAVPRLLLTTCLVLASALPVAAQDDYVAVGGRVTDLQGNPVAGGRVVCREADGAIVLSPPADERGEYSLAIPAGGECVPVAVVLRTGRRVALEGLAPVQAVAGSRRDLVVDVPAAQQQREVTPGDVARRFPGSDRLFLAFVEDPALVENRRYEAQLEYADFEAGDRTVFRGIVAFQFDAIPQVEFGARLGLGDVDGGPGVFGGSGLTDTDVWGKLHLGDRRNKAVEYTVGTLLTLPTGDEDEGLSFDALRSKLFGAARWTQAWGTISAHVGVRFNEDAEIGGFVLPGETSPAAGFGVIVPLDDTLMLVGEATFESERFQDGDADARLLCGVNWNVGPVGGFRFALAAGVADGAPDLQLLAGYAADF